MDLVGKVALVTGAGSGMGRAIAHALAGAGCKVAAVGRTLEKLETSRAEFAGRGTIVVQAADVASRAESAQCVRQVEAQLGPVDILVNNAGINVRKRALLELSLDDWDRLVAVNLTGAFYMLHAVLPGMRRRGGGLVIHISSIAGKRPSPIGGAGYSAAKFGLAGLSGVLSLEEASHGIRATLICPGEVNTPILDDRPEPVSADRRADMLQPEDVADAVLFVCRLPERAHVPELIIKPTVQEYA